MAFLDMGRHRTIAALLTASVMGAAASPAYAQSQEMIDAAKAEGRLTIYTGTLVEVVEALISGFRAEYPEISVDYWRGDTSQVTQRFETEEAAGRSTADLTLLTDRQSKILYANGLLEPYRSENIGLYPVELHGRDYAWSNYALTLASFAWNTDLVSQDDAPVTWDDLLDPKWSGKLGIQDPLQGGGAGIWFVTMYEVWGEEKWADYMQTLGAQNMRYGRYLQVQEMLSSGEIEVQVASYPNYIEPLKAQGGPAEWGVPEPVIYTGLSVNLSKNAPSPNAAKLFIDYMLSEDVQERFNELGLLPAMREKWPEAYNKLQDVTLYPQAHELEMERLDFFQEKMREYFVR
jgi:iron(III) transport system substrate-binding protein